MKIAPWKRSSHVGKENVFTKVTLENKVNAANGSHESQLTDLGKVFEIPKTQIVKPQLQFEMHDLRSKAKCNSNSDLKPRGKKILLVGKTATGKTMWGKKLAYDWAVGAFTTFSIVFLILLKSVKPGDSVETVIRHQIKDLSSSNITEETLRNILHICGDKCLLILDGLDEYKGNKKDCVFLAINGTTHYHCHILVTSRPHCIGAIEEHYEIVNIIGFTKNQAEEFASKILSQDQRENTIGVNDMLDNFYQCPLLLSIICSLLTKD